MVCFETKPTLNRTYAFIIREIEKENWERKIWYLRFEPVSSPEVERGTERDNHGGEGDKYTLTEERGTYRQPRRRGTERHLRKKDRETIVEERGTKRDTAGGEKDTITFTK